MENIYLPYLTTIKEIVKETPDVKTFKLEFKDEKMRDNFQYKSGQFCELSILGVGECTISIASSPSRRDGLIFSIKRLGKVTQAIHDMEEGDTMGVRGPYGNCFPLDSIKGKRILFIGGGIGLAALHSSIGYCLDNRGDYKDITIIYGARTVDDLVYRMEHEEWKNKGADIILTVDPGGETEDWKGKVGFVPTILEEFNPSPDNLIVITCGPPVMIKFTLKVLEKFRFEPEQILTTLELKMKCGFGKCGRCNIGHLYVCKDGPVFNYAQIKNFREEF